MTGAIKIPKWACGIASVVLTLSVPWMCWTSASIWILQTDVKAVTKAMSKLDAQVQKLDDRIYQKKDK